MESWGMAVPDCTGWASSVLARYGMAVSEGNGRLLRGLARMRGAWQSRIVMDR